MISSVADTATAPKVRARKMGAPVVSTGVLRKVKDVSDAQHPRRSAQPPPPGIFANRDAGNREKVASFLTRPIGSVTRLSVF